MEQEAKQHPYIDHIARSMQRMAYEYAKQIITRQLDVKTITVSTTDGFELTLTDKRRQQTPKVQPGTKRFRPILTAAQARKLTTLAQRHLNYEISEGLWLGNWIYELELADVEFGIQRAIAKVKREFFEEDANGNRLKYVAKRLKEQGYEVTIDEVYKTKIGGLGRARKYFAYFRMTVKW